MSFRAQARHRRTRRTKKGPEIALRAFVSHTVCSHRFSSLAEEALKNARENVAACVEGYRRIEAQLARAAV